MQCAFSVWAMVQPVVGEMDGDADSVAKLATFQTSGLARGSD